MKFCSLDITSSTDVDAIFARYRDTMAALERDFPDVTFIHVTVPEHRAETDSRGRNTGEVTSWAGAVPCSGKEDMSRGSG